MATPDFVLELRDKIGTAPLWLCGVTAVVVKGDQVLMVKRADNGAWTPVTGIVDPGEHPATAAMRETLEEAGVVAQVIRLARVGVTDLVTYDNGDQTQYVDLTWRLEWRSGEPHPADGENTEARWFAARSLPPLSDDMARRIGAALLPHGEAEF
ncbi:hypothetical protein BHE97_09540 [Aeromicrobium sp. PE09-221]|uniref:NUDIX hydrolase n=1 Tax=Aeromicrobium sp. PE09-221 TaxID=1898043 RepID=UPI000B3EA2D4|nr:NUDIX domain-containing protein [Aeromicrobium sp. PE09-221]OUZ09699.1 hypothetical protein BHE97_09540 [Aeromicrobium sp. PE09-221]